MMTLTELKKFYNGYDISKIDPYALSVIKLINKLPGCATAMCCAGAGPVENTKKQHRKNASASIFLICQDSQSMFMLMSALQNTATVCCNTKDNRIGVEVLNCYFWGGFEKLKEFERKLRKIVKAMKYDGFYELEPTTSSIEK